MTADQLVGGVFGVLAQREYSTLSIRTTRLDAAMEKAFEVLKSVAQEEELDLRFCISRDLYGDSQTVRSAVAGAVQSGLVGLDGPEYQDVRFTKTTARLDLDSLPGGCSLYERLADAFVAGYEDRALSYS